MAGFAAEKLGDEAGQEMEVYETIRDRIFEPFASARKGGEAMGLGLFIVQTIVGSHHGRISFYRDVGGDKVFRVEFPALDEAERQ